jgi:hypothetical protein
MPRPSPIRANLRDRIRFKMSQKKALNGRFDYDLSDRARRAG